jgi:hypothetical protein
VKNKLDFTAIETPSITVKKLIENALSPPFRVLMLGGEKVGKTSIGEHRHAGATFFGEFIQ